MSISLIKSALSNGPLANQMSIDAWCSDQELRGENVALYRAYADGDHRADLTQEMADMLRVGGGTTVRVGDTTLLSASMRQNRKTTVGSPFNLNRMDNTIQTLVDRLELKRMEDTGGAANDWALEVSQCNRLDALQIEVHESVIRDADAYVLVDWDNDKQEVRLTLEPAFDGVSGMLVLYQRRSRGEITCAVKVWHITSTTGEIADTMRVNVYYPDRIEKFISQGQGLIPYTTDDDETTITGGVAKWLPGKLTVHHFKNKAQSYDNYGRSEIDDAIPVQDAINRLMYSMVASAELGGIPVRVAKGFTPPPGLTPGAFIVIGGDGMQKDDVGDVDTLEQAVVTPFLDGMRFLIEQMDEITRTPNPKLAGDSASGESLKQREIGLLGKVKRAQISFGNVWEDVFESAHLVQSTYGLEKPPQYEEFSAQWRDAEIRNVAENVKTALDLRPLIGDEQAIRLIASNYDWSEDAIQDILKSKQKEDVRRAADMFASMPGYGGKPPVNGVMSPANTAMPMNGKQPQQSQQEKIGA
jgi:SPP1 Gp6-like portal protein